MFLFEYVDYLPAEPTSTISGPWRMIPMRMLLVHWIFQDKELIIKKYAELT